MNSCEKIVETRGIRKVYEMGPNRVEALRGLDFSVRSGEFVAIMGPSGSGKSTLMHILGCLERATEGIYLLGGQDISSVSDRNLSLMRANQIGFVFQTFSLISQYNVFENVEIPFLYRKETRNKARRLAEKAIERVGLSARRHHKPSELSGGEMQRVAIARALAVDPLLILADEPTGNLDSKTSKNIISLFQDLNEQGTTLIVVTHEKEVASHCQTIYHLLDGRIVNDEDRA
ncbi:MAG: ABC transporter ATP-binding protein [Desulfobacteraceae bacterium]|nr:ABC transporter ATP-binding protein [Desulfobacteraceae bacterium]